MAKTASNLIQKALNALAKETGLTGKKGTGSSDDTVRITVPATGREVAFPVLLEVVTPANLGIVAHRIGEERDNCILITDYVSAKMAERLKAQNIQFLDISGNAYLNASPLYVMVKGNKRLGENRERVPRSRAFQKAGTKVVYLLLRHPELQRAPLRKIAEAAGVSLGSVSAVVTNLERLKFLVSKGKFGLQLKRTDKLLLRWTTAYAEVLRPKLVLGRYTAKDRTWWRNAVLPETASWGGEVAAAKSTGYLIPETITLYTHAALGKLLGQFRLRKDPDGEIEILEAFWRRESASDAGDTVNPIIVYADLLATADSRNLEAAKIIYDNQIHQHIA